MVGEVDARAILDGDRIAYWLSVGAQPSDRVRVLIKKYGKDGTHAEAQQAALERLKINKPKAPPPRKIPLPAPEAAPAPAESSGEASAEGASE
jgi:small subunit ribosomal protein S16